jgi:hypothetical protein
MLHDSTAIDYRTPFDALAEMEEPDLEAAADLDVQEIGMIPLDALRIFCSFLLPKIGGPARWRAAAARLAVLSHSLKVDGVGGTSLIKLAEELGCSRSLLSLMEVELRVFAQLDHRAGKSDAAREVYSQRAKSVWRRRKGGVGESDSEAPNASPAQSACAQLCTQSP